MISAPRPWILLALLAAACTGARPTATRPQTAPLLEEDGEQRRAREEWFLQRLREADGTVREDASAHGLQSWSAWSASHAPGGLQKSGPLQDGRSWQEIGPRNIAGRVLSVALDPVDPEVIWAGSAGGGLWRSGDFGQTWQQMGGDHLPSLWIGALAVDPRNPQVLYMGTGETSGNRFAYGGFGGMLKTADGGRTFTRIPLPEPAFFRTLISATDSNLVLTAAKTGLYRSANAGGHFAKVLSGEITDLAQDPRRPARFIAVRAATLVSHPDSGLFESLDAGLTWHPLGTGLPADPSQWGRGAVAFSPASPVLFLALDVHDAVGPALFRSTDDGATWQPYTRNGQRGYAGVSFYGADLAMPAPGLLLQSNGLSILLSRDGGLNWTRPGGDWHVDTHGIAVHPRDLGRIVFATDGGVAVSTDSGATFQRADRGFPTVQLYSCAVSPRDDLTLFGGTQDNWLTVYRGAAGGAWEYSFPPALGDITGVSVNTVQTEVAAVTAFAQGIGVSQDDGRTWTSTRGHGIPSGDTSPTVARLARSPIHPDRVYLGGRSLNTSPDGGHSWQPVAVRSSSDPTLNIVDVAVSPVDDREIWTLWKDGKVYVSADTGSTWQERSPPGGSRAGLRISAGAAKRTAYALLSGTTGARLFRTRDGGLTWDDISRDLPEVVLNAVLADPRAPGRLLVATDAGVALSPDEGETWQDASAGLPGTVVFDLCLDPISGRLAAATYGRGVWELKSPQPCTPGGTALCLNANRFKVEVAWQTPDGKTGTGVPVALTTDSGYFWFFAASNVELLVKVLDGCGFNQHYWVFAGGLTNVQTLLTVTDTATGAVKTYANPQNAPFQPIQDVEAFASCQ